MSRSFSLQPASPWTLGFQRLLQKSSRLSRVTASSSGPLVSLRPCPYSNRDWQARYGAPADMKCWGSSMLKTVPAFDRIGEENALAVWARATVLGGQGRDIINLGIGQPDFRTPDFIVEAAIKALRDGHHGYTPAVGITPLREAVAADLGKRFKVSVSPDEVLILPGGKPTMFMSILMFGEPGVDILYPDPGFPIYRSMIEYTGARPIPVPIREENDFAFSAEETLRLITPQTRLLIVNSPANPTGGVTGRREVDKLVAGLEKFPDVAVMSDEIYDHMVYDGEMHVCLLTYPSIRDRLILLNGWSKTYAMTGGPVSGVPGEGLVRLSFASCTQTLPRGLGRVGEFLTSRKAA